MDHDSQNFEQLRRLLALKRHEQPPPGYFHRFSRQVIAQIQEGEFVETATPMERFLEQAPWLQRFWAALETKPVFAAAVAVAACLMLVAGVFYTEVSDQVQPELFSRQVVASSDRSPAGSILGGAKILAEFQRTNSFVSMPSQGGSLFGVQVQPVSFLLNN